MSELQPSVTALSSRDDIQIRFFVELIAIGQLLIAGYNMLGKPGGLDTSAMEGILDTLQGVNSRIDQVSSRIGELFSALDQLDSRIKGYITEAFVSDANALVRSITDDLNEILRTPDTIQTEVVKLDRRTGDLKDQLERIRQFTGGGLAACTLMAPGIALWVQAYTAIQRAQQQQLARTVWDHPFHDRNMRMFSEMFDTNARLTLEYDKLLSDMPKPDTVYQFVAAQGPNPDDLTAAGIPFKQAYSDAEGAENMFCYTKIPGLGLRDFFCHSTHFPGFNGQSPKWIWDPWWSDNMAPVQNGAQRVDTRLTNLKIQIAHHRRMMAGAEQMRPMLDSYCAHKPVTWGGTHPLPVAALVHLQNITWTKVQVEVRRGKENDCGLNAAFETRKLEQGELWTIPAPNVDVCYRRDRDPDHPDGTWSNWRRVVVASEGEYYEAIS